MIRVCQVRAPQEYASMMLWLSSAIAKTKRLRAGTCYSVDYSRDRVSHHAKRRQDDTPVSRSKPRVGAFEHPENLTRHDTRPEHATKGGKRRKARRGKKL